MQTWLDGYTYEIGEAMIEHARGQIREGTIKDDPRWRSMSVVEAAVFALTLAVRQSSVGEKPWSDFGEFSIPFLMATIFGRGFYVQTEGHKPPPISCLRPDRGLVEALSAASPPEGQEAAVRTSLCSGFQYFDIPIRALALGDTGLEIRAVLTRPQDADGMAVFSSEGGEPTLLRMAAVLCRAGSNTTAGVVLWNWGVAGSAYCKLDTWGVDLEEVRVQTEDFLSLLVLYRGAAAGAQRGLVPHASAENIAANPRRVAQRRKKYSLFRVETLAAPPDRFGREPGNGSVWKLGWRSTVKGHFRLQAHGPRWELRKLIWVDKFKRGPENAPSKIALELVR